jgi:hypothetical protein
MAFAKRRALPTSRFQTPLPKPNCVRFAALDHLLDAGERDG